MAEYVEQAMEEMMNEVEQMERVMLLQTEEVKELLKKRRHYEYKLQKRKKSKRDFLEYIQYESNLLSLLKLRRESTGYRHKQAEIEGSIKTRGQFRTGRDGVMSSFLFAESTNCSRYWSTGTKRTCPRGCLTFSSCRPAAGRRESPGSTSGCSRYTVTNRVSGLRPLSGSLNEKGAQRTPGRSCCEA